MWKTACRNTDALEELSIAQYDLVGISKRKNEGYRHHNLPEEINAWRVCLRRNKYLTDNDTSLKNINGIPLDIELVKFLKLAKVKSYYNISKKFLDEPVPDDITLTHPVYVTQEERAKFNDIANMTKDIISGKILKKAESITTLSVQEFFIVQLAESKSHSSLVQLYYEVQKYLQN